MLRRWKLLGVAAPLVVCAAALAVRGGRPLHRAGNCDARLTLPEGFCATLVADHVGPARHLAVAPNGDVYVALWREGERGGGVLALRDTTGDGRADVKERFGPEGGAGIAVRDSSLFFATWNHVFRFALRGGRLVPPVPPDTVVTDLPQLEHGARSIALDAAGHLFVNIGAPSNACERDYPHRDFAGDDPCRELETSGGIWRFDARGRLQRPTLAARFATGLRHTVALTAHPRSGALYGAPHGIDHLHTWWPRAGFSAEAAARKPSETLFHIDSGGNYGFPYCIHDPDSNRMVLAPAYGGDGVTLGRCSGAIRPLVAFPAHAAPMALAFYDGQQFPARYRGGLFIAFHGSLFHGPLEPRGFRVEFVPFAGGRPTGVREVFADARRGLRALFGAPEARPSGLAVGPDGALYVGDDYGGRVWRIGWGQVRRR